MTFRLWGKRKLTFNFSVIGFSTKFVLHVIVLQSSLMLQPSSSVEVPQESLPWMVWSSQSLSLFWSEKSAKNNNISIKQNSFLKLYKTIDCTNCLKKVMSFHSLSNFYCKPTAGSLFVSLLTFFNSLTHANLLTN